ncbi:MAG: hypothetical protein JWN78_3336 [Bacteroidota bacterium]|nr:hypothetical protein [Bacteroidota bacterium]
MVSLFIQKFPMKKMFLIALMTFCASAFSKEVKHKVDVKDDTVIVDEKPWFILEKLKAGFGTANYYLKDLTGKKLAYLKMESYKDPKEVDYKYNPDGVVKYYIITFLEDEQTSEMPAYARQSKIAEHLVKMELMPNGVLTDDTEHEFILVSGHSYQQKRNELGGNGNIIINNNNTDQTPRNGFNMHIGN